MPQDVASDKGLQRLSLIQQLLDTVWHDQVETMTYSIFGKGIVKNLKLSEYSG